MMQKSTIHSIPIRPVANTPNQWKLQISDSVPSSPLVGCHGVLERALQRFLKRILPFQEPDIADYTTAKFAKNGWWNVSRTLERIDTISVSIYAEDAHSLPDFNHLAPQCNDTTGNLLTETNRLGMEEYYDIAISDGSNAIKITAKTVLGVIRAFSRLPQLVTWTGNVLGIPCTPLAIMDYPQFAWRGLMVDTSRHFLPIPTLKRILLGMDALMLNVFHWHIVDAQSFPFQSLVYPNLTKGAYHPHAVYNQTDIAELITYASDMGIRIVPEFDIPAHTASWGVGYPELTIKCPTVSGEQSRAARNFDQSMREKLIDKIALDPVKKDTFDFLLNFLSEVFALFPDEYIHLGGDEVNGPCLSTDPGLKGKQSAVLHSQFTKRILPLLELNKKIPMFWDEVVSLPDIKLPKGSLIQFWRGQNELHLPTVYRASKNTKKVKPSGASSSKMVSDTAKENARKETAQNARGRGSRNKVVRTAKEHARKEAAQKTLDQAGQKARVNPGMEKNNNDTPKEVVDTLIKKGKEMAPKMTEKRGVEMDKPKKKPKVTKIEVHLGQGSFLEKPNANHRRLNDMFLEGKFAGDLNAQAILSRPFYLDHLGNYWEKWYREGVATSFIGAEACSWSEHVNENNIDERIFGRLPVLAELLWSTKRSTENNVKDDEKIRALELRLDKTLCRLSQRDGIQVASIRAGFCGSEPIKFKSILFSTNEHHESLHFFLWMYFPIWFAVGIVGGYLFKQFRPFGDSKRLITKKRIMKKSHNVFPRQKLKF